MVTRKCIYNSRWNPCSENYQRKRKRVEVRENQNKKCNGQCGILKNTHYMRQDLCLPFHNEMS